MIPSIYWIEKALLSTDLAMKAVDKGELEAAVSLLIKTQTALAQLKEANKWQIV